MSGGSAARQARALPTFLRVGFSAAVAYRGEFLVWVLSTNMPLVMLALFREVAREAPVAGYGEKDFAAYFLATLVVRLLTSSWVVWELNADIRSGDIAMRLLRPIHPFLHYAADNLAAVPLRLALAVPIAAVARAWLGPGHMATDLPHVALFSCALGGAWALTFSSMLVVGVLGLYWESSLSLWDLWLGLFFIFSGYLMPLTLFPRWLLAATWWMPFRYTLAFPVETILGRESVAQSLRSLAAQWAWVSGLFVTATVLWRRGVARYAAFGG